MDNSQWHFESDLWLNYDGNFNFAISIIPDGKQYFDAVAEAANISDDFFNQHTIQQVKDSHYFSSSAPSSSMVIVKASVAISTIGRCFSRLYQVSAATAAAFSRSGSLKTVKVTLAIRSERDLKSISCSFQQ